MSLHLVKDIMLSCLKAAKFWNWLLVHDSKPVSEDWSYFDTKNNNYFFFCFFSSLNVNFCRMYSTCNLEWASIEFSVIELRKCTWTSKHILGKIVFARRFPKLFLQLKILQKCLIAPSNVHTGYLTLNWTLWIGSDS